MISGIVFCAVLVYFYRKRDGLILFILLLSLLYAPLFFNLMPNSFSSIFVTSLAGGMTLYFIDRPWVSRLTLDYFDWIVGYDRYLSSDSTTSE